MTVRISYDEGLTWSEGKNGTQESAYSSLTILENGDIGLFSKKKVTLKTYLSFLLIGYRWKDGYKACKISWKTLVHQK